MLTDVFSYRYSDHPIWSKFTHIEQRLLVQLMGVAKDALPYYSSDGSINKHYEAVWKDLHDRVARELGLKELSSRYYSYTNTAGFPVSGFFSWDYVCEQYLTSAFTGQQDADSFIKERLNVIELAMRVRFDEIQKINADLPDRLSSIQISQFKPRRLVIPGNPETSIVSINKAMNERYSALVDEINERLRRSKVPLTLHNGFIQLALDSKIENEIAKPFWELLAAPLWRNVDIDMKEALDRRDSNSKDPAIFAAKALESTIKIISDINGWSSGRESGASAFIDNLQSKKNGHFIDAWEATLLRAYFGQVRNPISHGPGMEQMPELSLTQTDWAIENAMSWIRSLIRRIE